MGKNSSNHRAAVGASPARNAARPPPSLKDIFSPVVKIETRPEQANPLASRGSNPIQVDVAVSKSSYSSGKTPGQAGSSGGEIAELLPRLRSRRERFSPDATGFSASLDAHTLAQLEEIRRHIDQLPEINATRVVQLHQRIMAGDYLIDSQRLANKLLDLESALERAQRVNSAVDD